MNVNVTKIQRLPNGIIQFYNGTEIIDSFSITSSVSVLFENNSARNISFVSNVKTLSFNVFNITSVIGSTSNKTYTSGIDPSDTSDAYISRLYDIYAFIVSDVIQGCCPGPTFVGGVVATYPDYASFPATGQESVIYIDESTGVAYFWNGTSYQELISLSASDKMVTIGRNSTGSTLYQGTVIYISGSTGNRPNYVKAQANSEATSAGTFGVILADIANNSDGYAVTIGTIDNLDTRSIAPNPFTSDTLADGDTIYLSPTTAGYVTNVKPYAPSHLVYVGKVVRTSPTNGVIVYRIQNGYELDELHDVAAQTPSNNDVLTYESSTSLWKNKTVETALGYTPVPTTRTLTINGTTQDLSANRTFTIATGLTVGTTPITSGAVGRVLFEGTGNVLQESANLFFDASTSFLGVGTSTAVANTRAIIQESFTAQASTALRTKGSGSSTAVWKGRIVAGGDTVAFLMGEYNSRAWLGGHNAALNAWVPLYINPDGTSDLYLGNRTVGAEAPLMTLRNVTGNVLIGTTTDAGFKLDVNGTFRSFTSSAFTSARIETTASAGSLGVALELKNGLNTTTIGANASRTYIYSGQGSTENLTIFHTGNVCINSTTDAGFRLDVNGTARLNGLTAINGAGVANTALAVYGNGNGGGNYLFRMYDASSVQRFFLTASGNFQMSSATDTGTSGDDEKFRLALAFAPTSGTRNHYGLYITQTINQTGGANGITRGLYINPTLTAAADFRAIETTRGRIVFGNLPTSSAGLPTGAIWNDAGTLKIV